MAIAVSITIGQYLNPALRVVVNRVERDLLGLLGPAGQQPLLGGLLVNRQSLLLNIKLVPNQASTDLRHLPPRLVVPGPAGDVPQEREAGTVLQEPLGDVGAQAVVGDAVGRDELDGGQAGQVGPAVVQAQQQAVLGHTETRLEVSR